VLTHVTDASRVDTLLKFALAAAAQEDGWKRQLGPIHLVKYAYIGDLAHAERRGGETYTGAPWRFHHFGPWTNDVFTRIAPVVADVRAVENRYPNAKAEDDIVRWEIDEEDADRLFLQTEILLPSEVYSAVKGAVHQFGADTSALLEFVYLTRPMLRAAPGEPLDFHVDAEPELAAPPAPSAAPAMTVKRKRERKAKLEDMRERFRRHLAQRLASSEMAPPDPPPRYDEAFAEGQRWLDKLAGGRIEPSRGTLIFSDAVWKSGARRDPGIP
jgi:hypothetical protein